MTQAILYARFSPRPIVVICPDCGRETKANAGHDEEVSTPCPDCDGTAVGRNSESCESQLRDLREYCEQNNHEVVGEFYDKALSGSDDWMQRPFMLNSTVAARKGMLYIVRSYDRLFRDTDKALAFRAMLEAKGVEVVSATEPGANGDSMNAKLIRFIFLWMAEYHREIIRARTRSAMLRYQNQDMRRMSKLPPWGTAIDPDDDKKLVVCEEELEIARRIAELYNADMGGRAIARQLEAEGLECRGKKKWHHEQVMRILARFGEI